jgi:hypothetical protein
MLAIEMFAPSHKPSDEKDFINKELTIRVHSGERQEQIQGCQMATFMRTLFQSSSPPHHLSLSLSLSPQSFYGLRNLATLTIWGSVTDFSACPFI